MNLAKNPENNMYILKLFFFSAYWTAYELGEDKNPEINAEYLVGIIIFLNLYGCMDFFIEFSLIQKNIMVLIMFLIVQLSIYLIFIYKRRYINYYEDFLFLKMAKYKKNRRRSLVGIAIFTLAFMAIRLFYV